MIPKLFISELHQRLVFVAFFSTSVAVQISRAHLIMSALFDTALSYMPQLTFLSEMMEPLLSQIPEVEWLDLPTIHMMLVAAGVAMAGHIWIMSRRRRNLAAHDFPVAHDMPGLTCGLPENEAGMEDLKKEEHISQCGCSEKEVIMENMKKQSVSLGGCSEKLSKMEGPLRMERNSYRAYSEKEVKSEEMQQKETLSEDLKRKSVSWDGDCCENEMKVEGLKMRESISVDDCGENNNGEFLKRKESISHEGCSEKEVNTDELIRKESISQSGTNSVMASN